MKLSPIKNHIVFQFIDQVDSKGQFIQTTAWGFTIPGHFDNSAKSPRWVNVISVGPETEKVKAGQQALVPALMWSFPFKFEGQTYWRTDESKIVATRNTKKGKMRILGEWLVFERIVVKRANGVIEVIGQLPGDTPTGIVGGVGPKCEYVAEKSKIYFDDTNFFSNFEHDDAKLCFMLEHEVLAYEAIETKE